VSVVIDGILRFVNLFRSGTPRSVAGEVAALACPGCNVDPQVVILAEGAITVMCLNGKCKNPRMLKEHYKTEAEAVDAWNELIAPPVAKQRETIRASGSRSHFKQP
jgi:hypothetical protein